MKQGDILVSRWGATMTLATFVRVLKVSDKTLLVEELKGRGATEEETAGYSELGWLQSYVMPTENPKMYWDGTPEQMRLYPMGNGEWFSRKDGYKKYFNEWDGKPMFEDHCD